MRRFLMPAIFIVSFLFGSVLVKGAQPPSSKLPPVFQKLIPQGYKLESSQTSVSGTMGGVNFTASKHIDGRRDVYTSEYDFDLTMMEKPQVLVKSHTPIYQQKVEQDTQSALNSRGEKASGSDPTIGYDKPLLTKYPWGNGITQRVIHKYMGSGTGPDEIEYSCIYFGLIISGNVFKSFKLAVRGVDGHGEADQWANKVAEAIGRASLTDLDVK